MEKEYIIDDEEERQELIKELENESIIAGIETEIFSWFFIDKLSLNDLELINAFLWALKNGICNR